MPAKSSLRYFHRVLCLFAAGGQVQHQSLHRGWKPSHFDLMFTISSHPLHRSSPLSGTVLYVPVVWCKAVLFIEIKSTQNIGLPSASGITDQFLKFYLSVFWDHRISQLILTDQLITWETSSLPIMKELQGDLCWRDFLLVITMMYTLAEVLVWSEVLNSVLGNHITTWGQIFGSIFSETK